MSRLFFKDKEMLAKRVFSEKTIYLSKVYAFWENFF